MDVQQVRVTLSGFPGGPGVSTMYFDAASAVPLSALSTFWTAWKGFFPAITTITFPSGGLKYSVDTGKATGVWSGAAPAPITCTGVGGYLAPAGAVVNWLTGIYANGRQIRGRTFMVPLCQTAMDADGTFLPGFLTATRAAATAFVAAAPNFGIYSRPPGNGWATVSAANVPDRGMVLRSRRA